MLYVFLKYSHSGKRGLLSEYNEVSKVFKFDNEESLYNFLEIEGTNSQFYLHDLKQVKM